MLTKILLLFFLLPLPLSFAQSEVQYALVREVRGLEAVPLQIRERLSRLSMQVVLKQQGYQILLSAEDIPTSSTISIFAVESDVSKDNDRYQVETKLLDVKNKKLVRQARIKNIRESDLLRLFQASIEAVFKPVNEVVPEKVPEEKRDTTKKVAPPVTPQLKEANKNAIDFKERINAIKGQVDTQVAKVAEEVKKEESKPPEKKNPKETPKAAMASNNSSQELTQPEKEKEKYKGKSKYDLMVGWDKRTVNSDYYISTKTNTEMLTIKLSAYNTTRYFSERLAWSYEGSVSKLVSGKVDLPMLYQIGLYSTWLDFWGHLSVGFFRDRSFISNLGSPGEGLQLTNLDSDWLLAKTQIDLPFLKNLKLHLAYGTLMMVTSEISQDQWAGSMLRAGIIPPRLVANWDLNIILERVQLTNQGAFPFTSEDSRMALFIQRSF